LFTNFLPALKEILLEIRPRSLIVVQFQVSLELAAEVALHDILGNLIAHSTTLPVQRSV
jgi:hypothetical protein